jgi:2-amino-4-hydroxy-6-hydroxymethyldihydropteridine diphosphokinase
VLVGHGPVAGLEFSAEGVRRRDDLVLSGWMEA